MSRKSNFAWTLTDKDDQLLAYQELPKPGETLNTTPVEIVDQEEAISQCKINMIAVMDMKDPNGRDIDYMMKMKSAGEIMFIYCKLLDAISGEAPKPKSNLILPGDKDFPNV